MSKKLTEYCSFTVLFIVILLMSGGCATFTNSANTLDQDIYNIEDFGAVGDGQTVCTEAIQKAVDMCAENGGGMVYVPAGKFLTGPIFLRSNVNFHISEGATLLASENIDDYPYVDGRWEGIERKVYASLLTGHNLKNVSITGRGTLDGQGEVWWRAHEVTDSLRDARGIEGRAPDNPPDAPLKWPRPRMINLYNCENVLIRDITIIDSPAWTVHPVYCSNVTVENITIIQPYESPNTDGINPDSCDDVRIINCYVDVGDDCVTLKSGYNKWGREVGIPCENIVITNCTMAHGRGGVVIGSEMSGDVRNITISNCVFDGTLRGLRLKTARGRGGVVENIRATNIVMRNVDIGFSMTMGYEGPIGDKPQPVTEETPAFRDIHYSNITMTDVRSAATIAGIPEMPIENVEFRDMFIKDAYGGFSIKNAKGIHFDNVIVDAKSTPVLKMENVSAVEINRVTDPYPDRNMPVIQFDNVEDAWIRNCTANEGTGTFLEIVEGNTEDILMTDNRISKAGMEKKSVTVKTFSAPVPVIVQDIIKKHIKGKTTVNEVRRLKEEEGIDNYLIELIIDGEEKDIFISEEGKILEPYED